MYILRLSNISKKYKLEDSKQRVVLVNISLMFPSCGLVSIVGKSGSGKSTLLNIASCMDKPTNGCLYYMNDNMANWSEKRKEQYRKHEIGMVFQGQHLLENETCLYNIMLPALIRGKSTKEAEIAAKSLLKSINFPENLYSRIVKNLSGGERERIAILRALINDPKIIFADEPTGALDTKNSKVIMDLLKRISKDRLVILVSHNEKLVRQYSNQIIHLVDGHISEVEDIKPIDKNITDKTIKKSKVHNKWSTHLSISNFKRRITRNIISMVSLVIGLTSSMLIIGFSNGSHKSVQINSYNQLNYGVVTFYKETVQSIPGSKMSLVQMSRPSYDEVLTFSDSFNDFYIEPNVDALIPTYPSIKHEETVLEELSYNPIYSYLDESLDKSLLIDGRIPDEESLYEVVINKKAYEYLKKELDADPIGLELTLHSDYENHYYYDSNKVITDYFILDKNITIVGVVDDFNFLSLPKIYYSYCALKEELQNTLLVNLSSFFDSDVTWYDYLFQCPDNDTLSSYSYRLFLKDYRNKENLSNFIKEINEPYKIDSNAITIADTLFNLIDAATMGMELFLAIALVGTGLILGIISFSSYSEDKKTSAILTCLGANKSSIFSIYFRENLLIGFISLGASFLLSPLLMLLVNKIVESLTSFKNIISIPFLSFLNVPALFPIIIVVSTFLLCLISTYIPLFFSKKISPKEELMDE